MKPLLQLNQNNDYRSWVRELKRRYLQARLRASAEANRTLLEYYWSLGKDIADRQYANTYGSAFYRTLSHDLRAEMPGEKGFSETNIRYMCRFYELYSQTLKNLPHLAEDLERQSRLTGIDDSDGQNLPHPADDLRKELFSIPWDHQCRIVSKCKGNPQKALFFVRKVIENNWGLLKLI